MFIQRVNNLATEYQVEIDLEADSIARSGLSLWFCNCIINVKRKLGKMSFLFSGWLYDRVTQWSRPPQPSTHPMSVNYFLLHRQRAVANTSNKITYIELGYIYPPPPTPTLETYLIWLFPWQLESHKECGVGCNYRAGLLIWGSNQKNEYVQAVIKALWQLTHGLGHHLGATRGIKTHCCSWTCDLLKWVLSIFFLKRRKKKKKKKSETGQWISLISTVSYEKKRFILTNKRTEQLKGSVSLLFNCM